MRACFKTRSLLYSVIVSEQMNCFSSCCEMQTEQRLKHILKVIVMILLLCAAVVIDMYGFTCSRKPCSDGISLKG